MAKKYPYPDDLDDTSRTLIGLNSLDSGIAGGQALANLAKLLMFAEVAEGGPYRTWLVGKNLLDKWGDVDIAVNANIGALLAANKVEVSGLTSYIDSSILNKKLISPYYVGEIPTIYFLSAWYKGSERPKLKNYVKRALNNPRRHNSLMLALLITAGVNLNIEKTRLKASLDLLLSLKKNGHWPAEALYVDPKIEGVQYYAGSAALTTAFALEALSCVEQYFNKQSKNTSTYENNTAKQAIVNGKKLPANTRQIYIAKAQAMCSIDKDGQVTNIAGITSKAYGKKIPQNIIDNLNLASLNGWIAYSIYDDFLDDEGRPSQLGVANIAIRMAVNHYNAALPSDKFFKQFVHKTLDTVDAANTWEVINARASIDKNKLTYVLPNYNSYKQLANRSLGHMLAPVGVARAIGYGLESQELDYFQKFFHHYLIARQLNDDAHDWQDDLKNGHLNAVATMLLNDFGLVESIDLKTDLEVLRLHFWQHIIVDLSSLIKKHLRLARNYLTKCGMSDTQSFLGWLDALENATNQALNGSRQTQEFIKSYKGKA